MDSAQQSPNTQTQTCQSKRQKAIPLTHVLSLKEAKTWGSAPTDNGGYAFLVSGSFTKEALEKGNPSIESTQIIYLNLIPFSILAILTCVKIFPYFPSLTRQRDSGDAHTIIVNSKTLNSIETIAFHSV